MKEKVINLRKEGKTIKEICDILNISKGTVGFHLKGLGIKIPKSEEAKQKISKALKGKPLSETHKNNLSKKRIKKRIKKTYSDSRQFNFDLVLFGNHVLENKYHSSYNNRIKKWIFKKEYKEYKCEECGIKEYNNKPISLELDHINGDKNNNRLENLRILCPNCHSQTSTYKGKNKNSSARN